MLTLLQTQIINSVRKQMNRAYIYCSQHTPITASLIRLPAQVSCHTVTCLMKPPPCIFALNLEKVTHTHSVTNPTHANWQHPALGALAPGIKAVPAGVLHVNSSNILQTQLSVTFWF